MVKNHQKKTPEELVGDHDSKKKNNLENKLLLISINFTLKPATVT